jgi:hypothetical protein
MLDGVGQSNDAIGTARSVPQTFGIAIDRDNNTFKWTYDGSTYSSTYTIPSTGVLAPYIGSGGGTNTASGVFNFGADSTFAGLVTAGGNADENGYGDFSLAVPSGYLALCAGNLPTDSNISPTNEDAATQIPTQQFNILKYTGNGSERTLTTEFQADMGLNRSTIQGQDWYTLDTSRGWFGVSSNNKYLKMNAVDSEATLPQYNFKAQSGNDITLTSGTAFNSGSHTQQIWYWKANGGTTTTPSGGTLATTVQANTNAGFSIVQYVGDGGTSAFTLAHGLGKKPNMVLMKDRDTNGNNQQWHCYMIDAGSIPNNNYIYPSYASVGYTSTNGTINSSTTTSTVLGVNRTSSTGGGQTISQSGHNYLMYVWANIEGYSKFSSYTGNGNADGTYIHTGFTPAFIWIKDYDSSSDWRIYDTTSDPYNVAYHYLPFTNAAINGSSNTTDIDILSSGFKIRGNASTINTNGNRYEYMAWASNPFQFATAR